jgi:hypothetical protein
MKILSQRWDCSAALPLGDWNLSKQFVPSNPQDIITEDVFIRHPPQYTDSFLLFIKAVMIFGKVTDFNVRGSLRAGAAPSRNQNPFFLNGFEELDKLVSSDFLNSLPHIYKSNYGVGDAPSGSALDTDLYMVHIIPHACAYFWNVRFTICLTLAQEQPSLCIIHI